MSDAQNDLVYAGATQITSLSSSVGLGTIPTVNGATARTAWMKAKTNDVYVSLDGTPATSADMLLEKNTWLKLALANGLANIKVLEVAASAALDVWFFA